VMLHPVSCHNQMCLPLCSCSSISKTL